MYRKKYRKGSMTVWYSVLHMLVDGACALAMFGRFLSEKEGYLYILLYNFCAFALQMPFGVVLDALNERNRGRRDYAFYTAVTGVICTVLGALTHPVLLGIGNALFHVGGGVGVIQEGAVRVLPDGNVSEKYGWYEKGRGLGIFVAPGALGLYLGTLIAKSGAWKAGFLVTGVLMVLLYAVFWYRKKRDQKGEMCFVRTAAGGQNPVSAGKVPAGGRRLAICCMLVVVLRSYIGMTVGFGWKTGIPAGILATFALVGGKMVGGFAAAKWGACRTTVVSLGLSAVCYVFSASMPVGLAAVFLFNMTMPVTLYWMVCHMPDRPGFAFGFLTFALFLGFLPVYLGLSPAMDGRITGCAGSLFSLVLLAAVMGRRSRWQDI